MRSVIWAFVWGALFAVGLVLSGMTQPGKVIAFLDVTGDWDASLAFVMIGAILVHAILRIRVLRQQAPLVLDGFSNPAARRFDTSLVVGSAAFGIGWGVTGYCPGPAIVAAGSGSLPAVVVGTALIVGIKLADLAHARSGRLERDSLAPARAA
jgi:uncharacterized membrane protein YedE/YeeE